MAEFLESVTPKKLYNSIIYAVILFTITICFHGSKGVYTNTSENSIKLPIIMYHGFTNGGSSSEYVIDAKDFESDIVFLKENGFEFIDTNDLIDFVYHDVPLSKKPIMITFDDGYLNNFTYVFPIIKKYNIKVVISPIAYYVEYYSNHNEANPLYAQLTDKEITEMQTSGLVDFQNHSYNMHSLADRKGSAIKQNESAELYIREFCYDLKKAEDVLEGITGVKPHAYVYPFGIYSKESLSVLKQNGYKMTLGCEEGFNNIFQNKDCLFMLKRFNRSPGRNAAQILSEYWL